jgi:hypothetical protein
MFIFVWPNTLLDQVDISFWPKFKVERFLKEKANNPVEIVIGNESKFFTYSDLGIEIDVYQTMKKLRSNNFSELLFTWKKAFSNVSFVQSIYSVSNDFEQQIAEKIEVQTPINESYYFDSQVGVFLYKAEKQAFSIDSENLLVQITSISSYENKKILLDKIINKSSLENAVDKVNQKLALVFEKPIEIIMEGSDKKIFIEPLEIKTLLNTDSLEKLSLNNIEIKKDELLRILKNHELQKLSYYLVQKKISEEITNRLAEGKNSSVVLGIDTGPNTNGEVAKKYIEVDISQQTLYFFENNDVFKTYRVSTGLYYPTPAGKYKILNKSPLGFSAIFNVWMPYWMAFEYRKDIGAYLGIHELPYMSIGGEKIYRFGNYIGTKKTGGCVALSPGDSKEVYDRSFSGMDVIIFP